MPHAHEEFKTPNDAYVANYGPEKGKLPLPPGKKLLIGKSILLPIAFPSR